MLPVSQAEKSVVAQIGFMSYTQNDRDLSISDRSSTIGHITLEVKQTGERSAGNPHAAFDVAGTGNVARSRWCDTRRRKGETTGNTNLDLNWRAIGFGAFDLVWLVAGLWGSFTRTQPLGAQHGSPIVIAHHNDPGRHQRKKYVTRPSLDSVDRPYAMRNNSRNRTGNTGEACSSAQLTSHCRR